MRIITGGSEEYQFYTVSKVQKLPNAMGSVDLLQDERIIEVVKRDLDPYTIKKRYSEKVYIHQWSMKCGILKQRLQLGT